MKKYFVIEILRYSNGALGQSLFGVYDDLEKAKKDARGYNHFRGGKYPKIVVNEFDLNKNMPFEQLRYIINLEGE